MFLMQFPVVKEVANEENQLLGIFKLAKNTLGHTNVHLFFFSVSHCACCDIAKCSQISSRT